MIDGSLVQVASTVDQGERESIGIFWGKPRSAQSRQNKKKKKTKEMNLSSPIKMPQISASTSVVSLNSGVGSTLINRETQNLPPPCSVEIKASPMIAVLKTLLAGIQKDVQRFMSSHGPLEFPSKVPPGKYYPPDVEKEHMEYFVHQRSLQATRDTSNAAIVWARKTHCATDQNQRYCFDRRTVQQQNKLSHASSAKSLGNGTSNKSPTKNIAMENTLIKRNTQKIEHLMYVLQEEISKETARELKYLSCWTPARAISRQSQRKIANLVKERYEAADRIMRILEPKDYKIIVGVEAAVYLKRTIEEGKANGHLM